MSQRASQPPARESRSPADDQHHDTSKDRQSPYTRSDGGSFRRTAMSMSGSRASGELEGSTLGSSSRDGDRRTPNQRRTPSSGGFLLDSLPRSNSTRITSHRSRPSEPLPEQHTTPEPNLPVHKKRSRLPWIRHKNSASESAANSPVSQPNVLQDDQQSQASSSTEPPAHNTQEATNGLDRDSLQIVNLALNLNESRRRNASGLPLGSTGRRPLSVSQPISGPGDLHSPTSRNNYGSQDQSYRNFTQFPEDEPRMPQSGGKSPIVDLLPAAVVNDQRAYEFSDRTLARAERARRHFDLFHEYLRLLPFLPPLRNTSNVKEGDAPTLSDHDIPTHRLYNPLQMVRNRRIRYREKSPIHAEAEGWDDTEKVHEWINSIESNYHDKTYDETQSIKLPIFRQSHRQVSQGDPDDIEMSAVSPPSSLRRVSRTNSIKATRLRLDWQTSPAELIADAAWVESVSNKAKIVDKEGNKIYPEPNELVLVDANADLAAIQRERERRSFDMTLSADDGPSSRHTSLSSSHPARAHEFKSVGRGRHKHKFQSRAQRSRSRSISSSRKPRRWDRMRMRAGSASSSSSDDDRRPVDRKHRTLEHSRRDLEKILHRSLADSSESRISQNKAPNTGALNKERNQPPLSLNTKGNFAARQASFSSAGSLEDRYNPRASIEGMDSTAPNSPAQVAYFPSIAVNLSPPSSRSPSPAKRGLRHKIVARHERSKSKQGDREFRDHEEPVSIPEGTTQNILPPPSEQAELTSKLEPSPVPDVVSPTYVESPGVNEAHREDSFRGRKGQHMPESKLRGILKGPGRIAEMVGNEVSKVGDLILKKELPPDSRKSSSATTLASDSSDSEEEEKKFDKRSGPKGLLRRLPTRADEPGRLIRRDSDKGTPPRGVGPTLPTFTSPLRKDERSGALEAVDLGSPGESTSPSRDSPKRMGLSRSKTLDFGPPLSSHRGHTKPHQIKDPSVPFSLTRPPVTGLAQASPGSPKDKRPPLSGGTRAWSISDRSLQTLNDFGVPDKAEVERTRTLLLSSGIKAREITRRAHTIRDPPPQWLQNSAGSSASIPRVTRIGEFDLAAQNLLQRFEMTQYSFQQSMHHFTTTTSSPLRSQLKDLETLVYQTLTPRVRATADDAEDMCVQLNSTSTLAVKSLSDALDRGIRKRRRRLRWVRRTGFVLLEWALVAMLWWVWLIVMAFKVVRGVFRGAISGARWILWL
ncbi:hypothetical protein N7456_005671 [Penicillium angulare]|uniref:Uncharacterized protein n=1 Tax=Penicillium angulare TaxID=116970 RepID=A0A9W9FYZ4_9EURO|nr:hypothetical protein N7456_005671 [Penicillium angulare]